MPLCIRNQKKWRCKSNLRTYGAVLKWIFLGVAKLIQVMDDHLSIETNGFTMGSPKALRIGDLNPRLCGCFFLRWSSNICFVSSWYRLKLNINTSKLIVHDSSLFAPIEHVRNISTKELTRRCKILLLWRFARCNLCVCCIHVVTWKNPMSSKSSYLGMVINPLYIGDSHYFTRSVLIPHWDEDTSA